MAARFMRSLPCLVQGLTGHDLSHLSSLLPVSPRGLTHATRRCPATLHGATGSRRLWFHMWSVVTTPSVVSPASHREKRARPKAASTNPVLEPLQTIAVSASSARQPFPFYSMHSGKKMAIYGPTDAGRGSIQILLTLIAVKH